MTEELASTDTLTSVFNHGRIETELRNAIELLDKDNSPVGLLILDIDHFKTVNDRYGHAADHAMYTAKSEGRNRVCFE